MVGKSTVPVQTAAGLIRRLRATAPAGATVELAWNPEFLREGHAVEDTLNPDRVVVGAGSPAAWETLRQVYAPLVERGIPFMETNFATAELVKTAANSFLSMKISFINAMAEVCETTDADIEPLAASLALVPTHRRTLSVTRHRLRGRLPPEDLRAFVARGEELGFDRAVSFLRDVDEINTRRRVRMVDMAREQCGGSFSGKRVAVWGAAFKPESDDIRDSPALAIAESIRAEGAHVVVYDPKANDNARKSHPELHYSDSAVGAAEEAQLLLHATEWNEFREIDPASVGEVVRVRRVIDGRGTLAPEAWRAAGWDFRAPGRPDNATPRTRMVSAE